MAESNKPTFLESLRSLAAEAIQDIRHKTIEEPWFGREVTKDDPAPMNMQHNHDHQHEHAHSHSHTHTRENNQKGVEVNNPTEAVSPYVKDGLPATFDEYLAKHQGMGQERQPEQVQGVEMVQEQSQQQERER
jgi:ABC-type Zn2+ transport system substrate-binding protein/surface adhesin